MPISDEYGPSILGPSLDDYLDPGAIAYVNSYNDEPALNWLAEDIEKKAAEDDLPFDELPPHEELKGIIEWWCREHRPDVTV